MQTVANLTIKVVIEFTTDTSATVTGENIITYSDGSPTQKIKINGTLTKQQ